MPPGLSYSPERGASGLPALCVWTHPVLPLLLDRRHSLEAGLCSGNLPHLRRIPLQDHVPHRVRRIQRRERSEHSKTGHQAGGRQRHPRHRGSERSQSEGGNECTNRTYDSQGRQCERFRISLINVYVDLQVRQPLTFVPFVKQLLALLAVAVMGLVQLGLGRHSDSLKGNIFDGSTTSPGRYALALYSGLWVGGAEPIPSTANGRPKHPPRKAD